MGREWPRVSVAKRREGVRVRVDVIRLGVSRNRVFRNLFKAIY